MAVGDIITAARYNQIQSIVELVLGVGNSDAGYGMLSSSDQIQSGNNVTAVDINKLRNDLLAIYVHQLGSNTGFSTKKFNAATDVSPSTNIFTIPQHQLVTGQRVIYVAATANTVIPGLVNNQHYFIEVVNQSQFLLTSFDGQPVNISAISSGIHRFSTNLLKQITETVDESDYLAMNNLANILLISRNQYNLETIGNNFTIEPSKIVSVRRNPWGGFAQAQSVFHEVKVEFASPDARRHFFNTGGAIQFEASLTNFSGRQNSLPKFDNWLQLLKLIGLVRFNSFNTTASGAGTARAIGNFDLTQNYQTIYTKAGSGIYSVYSDNTYVIKAKSIDTAAISFLIEFNDLSAGVDDPVTGTLTSTVSQIRATGSTMENIIKVIASSPQYVNLIELSSAS